MKFYPSPQTIMLCETYEGGSFLSVISLNEEKKAKSYNIKQTIKQRVLKVERCLFILNSGLPNRPRPQRKQNEQGIRWEHTDCTAKRHPTWLQVLLWLLTKNRDRRFVLSTGLRSNTEKHHSYSTSIAYKKRKEF